MSNTKSNVGKSEETEEDCCCVIGKEKESDFIVAFFLFSSSDSNETAPKKTGDFENDLIDENFNVEIDNGIAQSSVDSATDEEEDWELSTIKSQQFYNEGGKMDQICLMNWENRFIK